MLAITPPRRRQQHKRTGICESARINVVAPQAAETKAIAKQVTLPRQKGVSYCCTNSARELTMTKRVEPKRRAAYSVQEP